MAADGRMLFPSIFWRFLLPATYINRVFYGCGGTKYVYRRGISRRKYNKAKSPYPTGAAFVVPELRISKVFGLPDHVSVFTYELSAILMALF